MFQEMSQKSKVKSQKESASAQCAYAEFARGVTNVHSPPGRLTAAPTVVEAG